jgi:TolB protein
MSSRIPAESAGSQGLNALFPKEFRQSLPEMLVRQLGNSRTGWSGHPLGRAQDTILPHNSSRRCFLVNWRIVRWLICWCLLMAAGLARAQTPLELFAEHTDVGTVLHPGSVVYDPARRSYTISGSGENVWAAADAFQFVWKKMEGDFTLTADISVLGQGGDPHKKAMLMARQSLDADSAYADAALHGVGLTSLQSRDAKGEATHEIQSNISAPKRLRLQKFGDEFTMWLAGDDGQFHFAGGSVRVPMTGAFYVGLGVCAHNKDAVETAEFGNVALGGVSAEASAQKYGTLETITVASTDRRVTDVVAASAVFGSELAAPNWTPDGVSLLFSHGTRIESVPVAGGEPKFINTGHPGVNSTEFHGISPDGTTLAVSGAHPDGVVAIFVVPIGGGMPRRVTSEPPSYWHGWSPDGRTMLFTTFRRGEFGIYTIPAAGGKETRLAAVGDGSVAGGDPLATAAIGGSAEYSPDGKYIYFNSNRSGAMEIWRMKLDGSQPEQVTKDGAGNWFPHVSPDGRLLAFLTPQRRDSLFPATAAEIALRVMSIAEGQIRVLAKLTGGLGTMPVPSWSPDSRRLAFVSYQGIPAGALSPQSPAPAIVK